MTDALRERVLARLEGFGLRDSFERSPAVLDAIVEEVLRAKPPSEHTEQGRDVTGCCQEA